MKVRDVMSSPVVSVAPDTSLLEAGELMLHHDISGLPVLDREAHLVGIATSCAPPDAALTTSGRVGFKS